MENKKKKVYDAPQLTVVSFKTERGFALSSGENFMIDQLLLWDNDVDRQPMESYIPANDWTEGSNSFWD